MEIARENSKEVVSFPPHMFYIIMVNPNKNMSSL